MLTFILIVVEIIGIEKYLETGKKRWLLLLPLTTWFEINCHASYWIMHFVVILPYCVPALPKIFEEDNEKLEKKISIKDLIFPLFSMIAVMFINPYGIKAILYVFYAITSGVLSYWEIIEQSPFYVNNLTVLVWIGALFMSLILWYKNKIKSSEMFMFLGLCGTFIFAIKWVTFYAIALMFLLRVIYKCVEEYTKRNNNLTNIKIPILYPIAIFITICGLSIHMVETYDSFAFLDNTSGDYMVNAKGGF
jgi:hypothetical protein